MNTCLPTRPGTTTRGLIRAQAAKASLRSNAVWRFYCAPGDRRHIDSRGTIQLWKYTYYVGKAHRNQSVHVRIDAAQKVIHVQLRGKAIKTIPLKGLYARMMDYSEFLGTMCDEARSEWKRYVWNLSLKAASKSPATNSWRTPHVTNS
jgi:hypothetical protein